MSVAVIIKETGTTVAILPQESAEQMVNNNPDMYAIREADSVDLLLKAAATIGDPILTQALVHHSQHQDETRRTPEQKAARTEQKKKNRKPESETPIESVSAEKIEGEVLVVEAKPVAKKRDQSPIRIGRPGIDRMLNVYQLSNTNFFRIRTLINHNFRAIIGTSGITWSYPREGGKEETGQAAFEVENRRIIKRIEETLKGLGCVKVPYMPWTMEEGRNFAT
jgi:hypothetical protein